MNRYVSLGVLFILLGVALLLNNNILTSNHTTNPANTSYNIFSSKTFLNNNYFEKSNSFHSFDKNHHLSLDFISLANAHVQNNEVNVSNDKITDNNDKYVMLIFDRGYKSTFTTAKPILDKYGFKATIFVACSSTESPKGMTWDQLRQLQNEGYDIQSHGSEHTKLVDIKSYEEMETIVREGKECLEEQGFSPTVFQAPYNKGRDDPKIVDIISRYFDFAFMGHSKYIFLNCDGWENFGYSIESYEGCTDCSPYSYSY